MTGVMIPSLSPDTHDHLKGLTRAIEKLIKELQSDIGGQSMTYGQSAVTDGTGLAQFIVADIPEGQRFLLQRALFWADGFFPGSAYSAPTAWAALYEGFGSNPANIFHFAPSIAGQQLFPTITNFGSMSPAIEEVAKISCRIITGPANTNCTVFLAGKLVPIADV